MSQLETSAQVSSSAKTCENVNHGIQSINIDQSTELREKNDLLKQIEELIEQYRANTSELSDIETLKKFVFWNMCCIILPRKFVLQHCSSQMQSAVTLLKQVFTIDLSAKIRNYMSSIIKKY